MFFGSVTEHVLRRSGVPVLAVPAATLAGGDKFAGRIGRVMAPVDFRIAPSTTFVWLSNWPKD